MKKQIKSKARVDSHGEVFTGEREINQMLELVFLETLRIDSRFLEPACGDGNFLKEILNRKLLQVEKIYKKNTRDLEKYSIIACASIYGIDIMHDNVKECRKNLSGLWLEWYKKTTKKEPLVDLLQSINFIFRKNIVQGDSLTMKNSRYNSIIFSEWAFVTSEQVQRSDFRFDDLVNSPIKAVKIKDKINFTENISNLNYSIFNSPVFIKKHITTYNKLFS